jgi:ParB family transcriptional regulator, chromosome partitioning protein
MTTGSAAKAGHSGEKEKEKTGIRRALGRGLESLLPGPRVVAPRPGVPSPAGSSGTVAGSELRSAGQPGGAVPTQAGTRAGAPAPHVQGAGEQQVPFDSASPSGSSALRAGSPLRQAQGRNDQESSEVVGTIQAVVEDATEAELRSAWTGEAPVPPQSLSAQSIPIQHEAITIQASAEGRMPSNLVVNLPLDHIDSNPYQTRYLFDEEMLKELAESIKAQGVVQPVVVRPGEDGRYVLILGERRCRASKLAGKTSIPAIVRRVSDQQAAEMTIIENLQREDLNCMEQAEAFRVLSQEFKLTQEQIGARVGMSRESVSNYMRLLKLPESVMEYLATDKLTFSDARELMMIDDPKLIAKAADIVVNKHLSIEKIEDLVMEMQGLGPIRPQEKGRGARWVDPNVKAAQSELERLLGVRVRIRDRRGKGKIVIEYHTVDDYERVVEALRGKK